LTGEEFASACLQPNISDSMWFFFAITGISGSGTPNIFAVRPPGGAKTL